MLPSINLLSRPSSVFSLHAVYAAIVLGVIFTTSILLVVPFTVSLIVVKLLSVWRASTLHSCISLVTSIVGPSLGFATNQNSTVDNQGGSSSIHRRRQTPRARRMMSHTSSTMKVADLTTYDRLSLTVALARIANGELPNDFNDNFALRCAVHLNDIEALQTLVSDCGVNPGVESNFAIQEAARLGHTDMVRILLSMDKVDPTENGSYGEVASCAALVSPIPGLPPPPKLVTRKSKRLVRFCTDAEPEQSPFGLAAENGHLDVVHSLLEDPRTDPAADFNYAICRASKNGHASIVKLLLDDPRVDPSALDNYPIRYACGNGHISTVRLLLEHNSVDASAMNNEAVQKACKNGHLEVVRILLTLDAVDPADFYNAALGFACMNGHLPVAQLLLDHPSVDASADCNFAIRIASACGHLEVVRMLLHQPNVDPDDSGSCHSAWLYNEPLHARALALASCQGHVHVVHQLLEWSVEHPTAVAPDADDNLAILLAMNHNHIKVIKLLCKDDRVTHGPMEAAMELAYDQGYIKSAMVLLRASEQVRVHVSADEDILLWVTRQAGAPDLVLEMLQRDQIGSFQSKFGERILFAAVTHGMMDVLAYLLARADVDPSVDENNATNLACRHGQLDALKLLLANKSVDPGDRGSSALRSAVAGGYVDIVKWLLEDGRVDEHILDDVVIDTAIANNSDEMLDYLLHLRDDAGEYVYRLKSSQALVDIALRHNSVDAMAKLLAVERFDGCAGDNMAIRHASKLGLEEMVRLLLDKCPNVDPGAKGQYAIARASSNGHHQIVKLLLACPGVDPSVNDSHALVSAVKRNRREVVEVLLEDGRVDVTACNQKPLMAAAKRSNSSLVHLLLSQSRVRQGLADGITFDNSTMAQVLEIAVKPVLEDWRAMGLAACAQAIPEPRLYVNVVASMCGADDLNIRLTKSRAGSSDSNSSVSMYTSAFGDDDMCEGY